MVMAKIRWVVNIKRILRKMGKKLTGITWLRIELSGGLL
jgi:hypothetical protein